MEIRNLWEEGHMRHKEKLKLLCIISLILFVTCNFIIFSLPSNFEDAAATEETNSIKYPPYPDVWGYEFPWPGKNDPMSLINVSRVESGDYMIDYVKSRTKYKRKDGSCCDYVQKFGSVLFFSGEAQDLTFAELNALGRQYKKILQKQVIFRDGSVIKRESDDYSKAPDPFSLYLIKEDKDENIVGKKHFVCLLDKPIKREICKALPGYESCERNNNFKGRYMIKRIENILPTFISLDDETFLFTASFDCNLIIRMDKDFKTRSNLLNRRLFILDRMVVENIQDNLKDKGVYNDQTMNNAVFEYVEKIRKEKNL
jgi:hypothetical protein